MAASRTQDGPPTNCQNTWAVWRNEIRKLHGGKVMLAQARAVPVRTQIYPGFRRDLTSMAAPSMGRGASMRR